MRQVRLNSPSTIDNLKFVTVDQPEPRENEVLVRVRASSLNFHDYLVVAGIMPAAEGRVPLSDGAGEVVAVGRDVSAFQPGDRVVGTYFPDWIDGAPSPSKVSRMRGEHVDGFASEYVALPENAFVKIPPGLSYEEAATLPCAGLTAWRALMVESKVKPGDTVLVQGTGGVSIFALQFARMAGATVIAITSSEEKIARLKELGAAHVVNYRAEEQWGAKVREITGGYGVDHVVEVVGGDLVQTLRACRTAGQVNLVGALSRKPLQFPAIHVITGNLRIAGLTVGSREHLEQMIQAIAANGLKPQLHRTFPLEEITQAFRHQEAKAHFGKICISV
jgi:NADPH:quinone reductase-like Zn-dependent oxidoreductase